jgi:thiol-disulfide isomerase/thioredoxin
MKKTIFLALSLLTNILAYPQTTIKSPKYSARTSSLNEITKVELTNTSTILYFKVKFLPGGYIVISDKSYIQPSNGGAKLPMKSVQGVPVHLNKNWRVPASGEITYSMSYPKIDPTVDKIDFMDEGGGGGSWNIYDIELKPQSRQFVLPENLMGNWLKTDGSNQWVVGFFNNLVIYDSDFWEYSDIQLKGKHVEVSLKKNNKAKKLYILTGKKGICNIGEDEKQLTACSQTKTFNKQYQAPEDGFSLPVFRKDSATYKGYIHGYSPKMGFKTGLIYVNNVFTGKQSSYTVTISPNGTFEAKIPLHYPTDVFGRLSSASQRIFMEPGKTTMQYIDWEEYIRNYPDWDKRDRKSLFMGDCATINADIQATDTINYFRNEMEKTTPIWVKIKRTGNQFLAYYASVDSIWKQIGETVTMPMSSTAYFGLCVTSHYDGACCTANISNVRLNKATPVTSLWESTDIGSVKPFGSFKNSDGVYTIVGSGDDIWDKADAFRYVYLPMSGDGEIEAKINSYSIPNRLLKVGVMIRESIKPGARYAMAAVCPNYGVISQERLATDSLTIYSSVTVKKILEMSLEQYKSFVLDVKKMEEKSLADYQNKYPLSKKSLQVIHQRIDVCTASNLTDYSMNREYAYRQANKIPNEQRKIPLEPANFGPAYFDDIKAPLNSPLSVLCSEYYFLINRIKYSDAVPRQNKQTISFSTIIDLLEKDSVAFTQEEKEWIGFTRENEKIAPEKKDTIKLKAIYEKYKPTIDGFNKKYSIKIQKAFNNLPKEDRLEGTKKYFGCGDMVMDIMKSQDYANILEASFTPFTKEDIIYIQANIKDTLISNIILEESNKLKAKIAENKLKTGFVVNETPKTDGDKLFDAMMAKFKGKVVYVDFWATWCGPCRNGIKDIAPLKEEMKNDSVAFVYITGETSPLEAWKNAIPSIKGEHFRVSADEWNILFAKFNISGIPHYALVNKKGELVNSHVSHMNNEALKQLLKKQLEE